MSKKWLWLLLVVFAAGALAAGSLFLRQSYEIVNPRKGAVTEAVYGLGKVKSVHRFDVKLGVMSTVKKVFVTEGQPVNDGDKLIEFENAVLFRAPFAGTVTTVNSYAGETALPQAVTLRLEDLKQRFIEVPLEQEGALRVRPGQAAKVSFESLRGEILMGKVTALYPKEDEFYANVAVENLPGSVLPGMTADVSIEIGQINEATLIPLKAIRNGTVTVKRGARREKIKIEVGHVDGLWAEVVGDKLLATDEVLVPKVER